MIFIFSLLCDPFQMEVTYFQTVVFPFRGYVKTFKV